MKAPTKKPAEKAAPAQVPHDPGRFVSQDRLATILGRNRATMRDWDKEGMPCVRRGDKAAGATWLYDLAEVVKWREGVVADRARKDALGDGGTDGEGKFPAGHPLHGVEAKDRPLVIERYARLAILQKSAVKVQDVGDIATKSFRDISNGLMSMPELAARDLTGFPDDVVRDHVKRLKGRVNDLLRSVQSAHARAMSRLINGEDHLVDEDAVSPDEYPEAASE